MEMGGEEGKISMAIAYSKLENVSILSNHRQFVYVQKMSGQLVRLICFTSMGK
jgi:hypothetical protein